MTGVSLKSVNTADLKSIDTKDLESPDIMSPQPHLVDVEKNIQRVLEKAFCAIRTGTPDVALELEALVSVQSAIQREIDSLVQRRDGGDNTKDEAETLPVPPSPPEVPEVPEPADAPGEEDGPCDLWAEVFASSSSDGGEPDDEGSDSTDTDKRSLKEPVYDKADDIYRCANPGCGWEVAFGYCHGCQTEYMMKDDESEAIDPTNSLTVFRNDILVPRGDSPLPNAIPDYLRPSMYNHNPRQFDELILRGATLAFCQAWKASFDQERGIVVRADHDYFVQLDCDFVWAWGSEEEDDWEIWIGRRIKLGDDDPEGIKFMRDLLELALAEDRDELWITYKACEYPTRWVTRPREGPEIKEILEVLEVVDEYEWSSEEEDDQEPYVWSSDSESPPTEAKSTTDPATSECESTWWSDDSGDGEKPAEAESEGSVQTDESAE